VVIDETAPMVPSAAYVSILLMPPESEDARSVLRSYFDDIVSRYYGRQATADEIDSAMRDSPSDDLAPPRGLLLVARWEGAAIGCAGLRLLPSSLAEVKRVFVAPAGRGRGIASRLLRELEVAAHDHGVSRLRLDTRHDLVEARRLYARHRYEEVPAFNDDPYADHWFEKTLT
jgi:ribosomal protein S18 acetylase RimI-like enzyme